jgi:hypothetical protein
LQQLSVKGCYNLMSLPPSLPASTVLDCV